MKYIKKYNEELRSSTYKRASEILARKGHKRRASSISNWADITKEKEMQETRERCKKLGVFNVDVKQGDNYLMKNGQFYLNFYFDYDNFKVSLEEWKNNDIDHFNLYFVLGLIPATDFDDGSYDDMITRISPDDNGVYWVSSFAVTLSNHYYGAKITPRKGDNMLGYILNIEHGIEYDVLFSDRKSAVKFRNLIYDIFKGNIDHKSGVHDDTKDVIMDLLYDEVGITIEEFEEFLQCLKITSVNRLYKD